MERWAASDDERVPMGGLEKRTAPRDNADVSGIMGEYRAFRMAANAPRGSAIGRGAVETGC